MHPTAARLQRRLEERGLQIEVVTLSDSARLGLSPANAELVRAVTGFSIGGVPPLGHDTELATTIDASLRRFTIVWAAAGTPHDVFAIDVEALIDAIPGAQVTGVS
jgi:prolyl-tRNA editing enzyme YbaK/EbsC (Cys-tRNA(Pro) deacylase)